MNEDVSVDDEVLPRPLAESSVDDDLVWALLDAAPDALVVIDDAGFIELVNSRSESLFGYHRSELLGQPVEILVPETARSVHRAHRNRYRAAPTPRSMGDGQALRGRRADGSEFPVEISLSPAMSGGRRRILAAVRDVTHRLEAERNARAIRHAIDTAVDGILIVDEQTMAFTYVNDQAAEMHGYTVDEMIGMTPLHLAPDLDEKGLRELLAPLMTGELGAVTLETTALRKDGLDFPVEVHINHPPKASDQVIRPLVAVIRDISDRTRMANELSEQRAMGRVMEDRERVARDLHDRVIGDLFGMGMTLQGTVSRIADKEVAERVQASVTSLDDVIKLVRSTIFGLTDQPSQDLQEFVQRRVDAFRQRLGHTPSLAVAGVAGNLPAHLVDEIAVVVDEALTNIAKHAEATETEIVIDVDSGRVSVAICDNGRGLPDRGAHRQGGLGVGNMRKRAENLGGTFSIEQRPASGVKVAWQIPL